MVEIVDELLPPLTKESVFVFKVYKSPKDGETVLGYMEPYGVIHPDGHAVTWISTDFGVPVLTAFSRVVELAALHGVQTVLVSDPDSLFPQQSRPQL